MEVRPPLLQIKETCIYVKDLDRSLTYYRDVLGLECFSFVGGSHAFFKAGSSVLLCFDPTSSRLKEGLPRHFGSGELHFAFEVDKRHYDQWLQWLKVREVPVEHEHTWPGGYRSFYFRDPDQHCVEIIEAGMWEYGRDKE